MTCQSAITTLTRTTTVASGVFAPGHLGELTQHVPFELVDAVLEETGAVQRRLRMLPSRVGIYFLLALGMFPSLGYAKVWNKLVAGLAGLPGPSPSEKALREMRRRLGIAPVKRLFEVLAGPLAQPATPGTRYHGLRTVAFDGCVSFKTPDAERNRGWLGRIKYRSGWAGYPAMMLMALVETGTRGLLGAVFGPNDKGESAYACRLLDRLTADMLVLADRAFDGNDFLTAVSRTGAQFLIRTKSSRRPPVLTPLPDGSFLTRIAGLKLRVIDADITVTTAAGQHVQGRYRLLTTLLNHRIDPAEQLVRLYHERWEIESCFYSLRHTLLTGRVLRSGDPVGVEQEMWALLTAYQVLRIAMVAAIESAPGLDPDRASFTTALETARNLLIAGRGVVLASDDTDLVGDIGRAVLADLLPPRRLRTSIRKVKCPISRYPARPADTRPLTSQVITGIAITLYAAHDTPPQPPLRHGRSWSQAGRPPTSTPPQASATSGRQHRVLTILATEPDRAWHGRELARMLDITSLNSFCVQLSQWASAGIIRKTGRAQYTVAGPAPCP